ncbi:sigma factor-like helix-turn-helix DNA-binding protein [Actinoplanes sp. NPDC089786]|uniref:sigma factor-like helix-turn-helix DNA-binding protein n=1 Tax=Actinoplanes sp. NPDC089786 TaxID=3155185 RepID=UPI003441EF16
MRDHLTHPPPFAQTPGEALGNPAPAELWIEPIPDAQALPEDTAVLRESIRLAFIAALQHLPPKQRAVLILRDVLCWRADEVATLLETTTASVTSALQRARATVKAPPGDPRRPDDPDQRDLLNGYCKAFESHDVTGLVALLHEDATMTMPPFRWWLRGRDNLAAAFAAGGCEGATLIPTEMNGSPAFWQHRNGEPFGLVILTIHESRITNVTTFLRTDGR